MDDVVLRAMARWPNVPAVYDWLALDRRGRWRLRGDVLSHPNAKAFIDRNYGADQHGRWYFQNGPQQVFVALDYTPWVLRLGGDGSLYTHTGEALREPQQALVDEDGNLLLVFESGIGLVEDRDLEVLSEGLGDRRASAMDPDDAADALAALAAGDGEAMTLRLPDRDKPLSLHGVARAEVPTRFGFDADPQPIDAR